MTNDYQSAFEAISTDLKDTKAQRFGLIAEYGFSIPAPADLELIGKLAGRAGILEVGAGLGYWASLLDAAGVAVDATDIRPPVIGEAWEYTRGVKDGRVDTGSGIWAKEVRTASAAEAIRGSVNQTLLSIWADYDFEFVTDFRGSRVIVVQIDSLAVKDFFDDHYPHLEAAGFARTQAYDKELFWPRVEDRLEVWER